MMHAGAVAIRHVEDVVGKAGGTGYSSWVHLDDAASATVLAVEQQAKGVFNIVDDEPAPASEWLPYPSWRQGFKEGLA
jgi:NAD dependent epimerase/dehydratase family enzyme